MENKKHPSVSYELAAAIQEKSGTEVRVTVPGHTQRGGSPCPYDRVLSTRLGAAGADAILHNEYGYMIGIVNGKVKKGDYVDIIVNMSQGSLGSNSGITKTIIQGVEVFDVGGENESINTITLLLTLEQAEIVKHAYTLGSVTYALNPGNAQTARTTGIINKSFCERYNFNCVGKQ